MVTLPDRRWHPFRTRQAKVSSSLSTKAPGTGLMTSYSRCCCLHEMSLMGTDTGVGGGHLQLAKGT